MESVDRARELARSLVRQRIDPNEVSNVFRHLRDFLGRAAAAEGAQRHAADQWWRWLGVVAGPGSAAVQRSRKTGDYYKAIEANCRQLRHLPPQDLVQTLGWAIRLMRYYGSPGAIHPAEQPEPPPPPPPPPEPPKAPQIPAVGETYTGPVLEIDESAVVVGVPGFEVEQAIGVIKAEDLGGRRFREGNSARVEVVGTRTLKNGRTVLTLKPAKRPSDESQ